MGVFVGIDLGSGAHAVCVIDAKGTVLDRLEVGHDRDGLAALVARLSRHRPPGGIPIAVERPSGLLVDALVEAGFVVTPIHPNVLKACRPRYRAVSAKSDPGDAYVLADNSRHQSPWAADVYKRARARGCAHPHAIRILARAWARVLWRAWVNGQPYDPHKHTAARPFLTPQHQTG